MAEWIDICEAQAIPPGHAARIEVGERPIAIFNVEGEFHCLDDTCSHALASLSEGELHGADCTIECPLHGSQFDLRSGEPRSFQRWNRCSCTKVEVRGGGA
ncbi:Rieske (2Fe-2S) domain protein, partial [mine drainage metagenome]